jgi:hypothetical protein
MRQICGRSWGKVVGRQRLELWTRGLKVRWRANNHNTQIVGKWLQA